SKAMPIVCQFKPVSVEPFSIYLAPIWGPVVGRMHPLHHRFGVVYRTDPKHHAFAVTSSAGGQLANCLMQYGRR
ncbi:MAG: hypothetical protein KGO23_14795, partial [Nitrospirota bacterium]|nr:hypothetical protein [Nitrospirota bacterium]